MINKKNLIYSEHGHDFYDYKILINDIYFPINSTIDSKYKWQFICIDLQKIFEYLVILKKILI